MSLEIKYTGLEDVLLECGQPLRGELPDQEILIPKIGITSKDDPSVCQIATRKYG